MKYYISLNIKVISQYQFVCTRLSSAHTPTRELVGVWALDKLVHTNRYCEITYNIKPFYYERPSVFKLIQFYNYELKVWVLTVDN